jgi:hypothetical protein
MKYIFIMLLVISCATPNGKNASSKSTGANKYTYLQEFYKVRDVLKKQTKSCRSYSKKYINQVLLETPKSENSYGYKFKNSKKISRYLKSYDPKKFDWYLSAKLKTLYLNFPYNEEISKEHFEISNNIRDCTNEFDNLNFLYTTLSVWKSKKSSKTSKRLARKVFEKYFSYIREEEVSLLSVLVTNSLLQKMEQEKLIEFQNRDQYLADSRELELLYTQTGRKVLKLFRDKDYSEIYKHDQSLRAAKKEFKIKMMQSFIII